MRAVRRRLPQSLSRSRQVIRRVAADVKSMADSVTGRPSYVCCNDGMREPDHGVVVPDAPFAMFDTRSPRWPPSAASVHAPRSAHSSHHGHRTARRALRDTATIYLAALLALTAALLGRYVLTPWMGMALPLVTVFAAIATAAWLGGARAATLVSVLGYVLTAWLLLPGHANPLEAAELGGPTGLVAYLLTCVVLVGLVEAARRGRTFAPFQDPERVDREACRALRSALRHIDEAVVTADAQGCVTTMNPVAELLTGWCERDAVGEPLDDVVHLVDAVTETANRQSGCVGPGAGWRDRRRRRAHRAGEPPRRRT